MPPCRPGLKILMQPQRPLPQLCGPCRLSKQPLSNTRSVSGYYTHREDLLVWQRRMQERGWRIRPDGLYGDETARVARDFQNEKGLAADALVGRDTWNAAWESPVT